MDGWQSGHRLFMEPIVTSGLWDEAETLTVGWAAPPEWIGLDQIAEPMPPTKLVVVPLRHGMNENPTLDLLWQMAKRVPAHTPLLYIHCRGLRYKPTDPPYEPVRDHNAMMRYFLIEKWREAVANLVETGASVAGCNVEEQPFLHVSGNMWWADSSAIAEIPESPLALEAEVPRDHFYARRNLAEQWLGRYIPREKFHCLHTSGVHHYLDTYPRERYAFAD